jgi:hypothetical protein
MARRAGRAVLRARRVVDRAEELGVLVLVDVRRSEHENDDLTRPRSQLWGLAALLMRACPHG